MPLDERDNYFGNATETKRVNLNSRIWVELKTRLPYGDRKRLEVAAMSKIDSAKIDAARRGEAVSLDMEFEAPLLMRLAIYLTDWNVPGPDGSALPLPARLKERMEVLDSLDEDVGLAIAEAIDAIEAEQKAQAEAGPAVGDTEMDPPSPVVPERDGKPVFAAGPAGATESS